MIIEGSSKMSDTDIGKLLKQAKMYNQDQVTKRKYAFKK